MYWHVGEMWKVSYSFVLYLLWKSKMYFPGKGSFPQCLSVPKNHSFMVWHNDAGPLVNHRDEEQSRPQDGHQEERPEKHSIQNLGYKLPILDHLKGKKNKWNRENYSVLEKPQRNLWKCSLLTKKGKNWLYAGRQGKPGHRALETC